MVAPVAAVVHEKSEKRLRPLVAESAIATAVVAVAKLPYWSRNRSETAAEQLPATTDCAAEANASAVAGPAVIASVWVAVDRPEALANSVAEPATVPWK